MVTQGKWEIEERTDDNGHLEFEIHNGHRVLANVNTACGLAVDNGRDNAALIAAAPKLLAACGDIATECFDAMEGAGLPEFENYRHWMEIAKAAIEVAKGV